MAHWILRSNVKRSYSINNPTHSPLDNYLTCTFNVRHTGHSASGQTGAHWSISPHMQATASLTLHVLGGYFRDAKLNLNFSSAEREYISYRPCPKATRWWQTTSWMEMCDTVPAAGAAAVKGIDHRWLAATALAHRVLWRLHKLVRVKRRFSGRNLQNNTVVSRRTGGATYLRGANFTLKVNDWAFPVCHGRVAIECGILESYLTVTSSEWNKKLT